MEMYCVSSEKNTSNENSGVRKTKKKNKEKQIKAFIQLRCLCQEKINSLLAGKKFMSKLH